MQQPSDPAVPPIPPPAEDDPRELRVRGSAFGFRYAAGVRSRTIEEIAAEAAAPLPSERPGDRALPPGDEVPG